MAIKNVTDDNFDAELTAGDAPVVMDFWAEWCGPCKQMAPHLDALAEETAGSLTVAKINVEENPMSAAKFAVRGLPTLILFKEGKEVARHAGAMTKQRIADWVKESLN